MAIALLRYCVLHIMLGSKVLLQNQRLQDRKGGKFLYKWIRPYTIKSISKTGLCVLSSEKDFVLKKKYNISLLKPYNSKADSDPREEINEKDQDSNIDRQQQTAGKNLFEKIPDEILEMILMNVTKLHAIDAFYSITQTCKSFQSVIEGKKDEILPMVHIYFPENVSQNLPGRGNKIKVSVKKLSKFFDSCSGVIECVSKAIGKKLWRSAWLLITKRKHNWFIIELAFWKQRQNIQSMNLLQQSDIIDEVTKEPWLGNEMYILKKEHQHLLLSKDVWLNDRIMDAAQKLIYKEIGTDESYQTVLNSGKKTIDPFHPVSQEHVQLLHDGANHCFLRFCSNGHVQVCDSFRSNLTRSLRKSIQSHYKHYVANGGEQIVTFLPIQKHPDGRNCGPFAIAYAAEILDGRSPSEAVFDVNNMHEHLITCLEMQRLIPIPKVSNE